MKFYTVLLFALTILFVSQLHASGLISDFYTDKARYNPGDTVIFYIPINNVAGKDLSDLWITLTVKDLDSVIHPTITQRTKLSIGQKIKLRFQWSAPSSDFRGYLAEVRIADSEHQELDYAVTAVDISSDWSKFPRYGYLAHFGNDIDTKSWISELNKYHINGLQYYDFQYKHHWPLPGTVAKPLEEWKDIAGRPTYLLTVMGFLNAAHACNMMNMAYNASYGAYADAFHDGSGAKLEWAAWPNSTVARIEETIKSYGPFPANWSTQKLYFMNQNNPDWQSYIYSKMSELFVVYPFDGWHIDTYGDTGAYAYDDSYIDYVAGFRPFADRAHDTLNKRVLFNTVASKGQGLMTKSKVDFMYSELWDDHPTYESLWVDVEEIHSLNPTMGIVFPAYMHKQKSNSMKAGDTAWFNTPSVLLTDAVMFASGASHLELGDGDRMLSTEYFPDDKKFLVSPPLHIALRHYYDFLVGYENYLRDEVQPTKCRLTLFNTKTSYSGDTGTIWLFSYNKTQLEMIHLINLLNVPKPEWRDNNADYPDAPLQQHLRSRLRIPRPIESIGWASPDIDGGQYHPLAVRKGHDKDGLYLEFSIPSLKYWDMLIIKYTNRGGQS